ncbi:MAG: VWA domain-containing protein [Candidatus Binatia bacterium]|nr:VWA domain-containing protein [Candidatus Binatia bacterium]
MKKKLDRDWLAQPLPTEVHRPWGELVPHWVETDTYDAAAFAAIVRDSPSLQKLAESGQKLVPHFGTFLFDIYGLLYKANIVLRGPDQVLPSAGLYRVILEAILRSPGLPVLRERTVLDEYQSGLATLLLGEKILSLLRSERLVSRAHMLDYWSLEHQERELVELGENRSSAAQLATQVSEARQAPLAQLSNNIDKQARLVQRSHMLKARDVERTVRETVERQFTHLSTTVARVAMATSELEEQGQDWQEQWGGQLGQSVGLQIELGKRLADNPRLRKLARLLGRMRAVASALRQKTFERANQEVHAINQGSNLSRLLPSELSALRNPWRRRDFGRRLLEGTLLQYDLRGPEQTGRGPMVVCLDVSSSMSGDKEIWAKAIALTLLDIAQRQKRLFRVICFSSRETPLLELDLNPCERYAADPHRVLDFAAYFPGGGTDFQKPLDAAVKCLQSGTYRKGDLIFITDGECQFEPGWLATFREHKQRLTFRLFAVLIDVGSASLAALQQVSDRVTSVRQLTAEAGAQLFLEL